MKRRGTHASFEEADVVLEQALEELDVNVPNYNEWLRSLLEPAARGKVLEVGAGRGTFTLSLLQTAEQVVAVEPSERAGMALAEVSAGDGRVTAIQGYAA